MKKSWYTIKVNKKDSLCGICYNQFISVCCSCIYISKNADHSQLSSLSECAFEDCFNTFLSQYIECFSDKP